jgi:hypothetical protein
MAGRVLSLGLNFTTEFMRRAMPAVQTAVTVAREAVPVVTTAINQTLPVVRSAIQQAMPVVQTAAKEVKFSKQCI